MLNFCASCGISEQLDLKTQSSFETVQIPTKDLQERGNSFFDHSEEQAAFYPKIKSNFPVKSFVTMSS